MAIAVSTASGLYAQAKSLAQATAGARAERKCRVLHAAQLARGGCHLHGGDLGRNGGEPDPAVAARSRAAFHIEGRREPPRVCAVGSAPAGLCRDDEPRDRSNGNRRRRSLSCGAMPRSHTPYASLLHHSEARYDLPVLDPDAVRMVLYTSGTTGRPKGVLHSHNSIHALICQIREHWLVEPGDKFLVPSPIAHIGGSIYAFECPLILGTTAVLMERWNADDAVRLLDAEACTHMAGATPFLGADTHGRAAGRHACAKPEAVCLRRRIRTAFLDPQSGRVFRGRRCHARVWVHRSARHNRWSYAARRRRACRRYRWARRLGRDQARGSRCGARRRR